MSSCHSQYGPKVKHPTKEAAKAHLEKHQQLTKHLCQVYRCPKCQNWHIGRKPAPNAYRKEKRRDKNIEEYLVGRLVGVLRKQGWRLSR